MPKMIFRLKGGEGSGFRGHTGRPGKVGGSQIGVGRAVATSVLSDVMEDTRMRKLAVALSADGSIYGDEKFTFPLSGTVIYKQLPVDEKSKRALIQARTSIFHEDSNNLARQLYIGEISIGSWEEMMKKMIRELHSSNAAIGKGGWTEMTYSDWGRLGSEVKKQYQYLHGFANNIADNSETVTLEAIQARSRMYGNAGEFGSIKMAAGEELAKKLPWLPKDGSTQCLVNCKCYWKLDVVDEDKNWKYVQAVWHLRPAEHCDDCNDRFDHTVLMRVNKESDVPSQIG